MTADWKSEKQDAPPATEPNQAQQSLIILKSSAASMKTAEAFLKNRNWTVYSTHQLRETLAFVIQKNPGYILIAADHSNKKVKSLPKLLAQAFQIKIIAYAENSSNIAMGALHEMGQEYTLFPPVSGPAIERMILKIQRDVEQQKANPELHKIKSSSGKSNTDEASIIQGGGFEAARKALTQLISDGDGSEDSSGVLIQKGKKGEIGSSTSPDHENPDSEATQAGGPSGEIGSSGSQASTEKNDGVVNPLTDLESALSSLTKQNPFLDQDPSQNSSQNSESELASKSETGSHSGSESNMSNQGAFSQSQSTEEQDSAGIFTAQGHVPKSSLENQSIIVKGTHKALEETIQIKGKSTSESIQKIEKASNIACIVIESPRFSGYLVAALGKNRQVDEEFVQMIRERLFSFLKTHGEVITEETESQMSLQIQEVEFEDWALKQAEFLKKSVHDGDEIAMAFFPTKDTKVKLEESVSERMLQMTLTELRDDTPVEFDLYIYMPENQKYLLYTPQGKTFYGKQKERLIDKGVSHIHLRKENTGQVKKYRAQNFLNDKIQAFLANKKS